MIEVDGSTLEGKRAIIRSLMRDSARACECTSGGIERYMKRVVSEIEAWVKRLREEHPGRTFNEGSE